MRAIKADQLLFFRILSIVIVILFVNVGSLVLKYGFRNGLTGFSIGSTMGELYTGMPLSSKIFFFAQWVILITLLIFIAIRDKDVKDTKKEVESLDLRLVSNSSKTDLDTLYNLLKEKGKIKISTIATAFKIEKDLAMEWAKTLEDGKLAVVDYPSFGGPILKSLNKPINKITDKTVDKTIKK